MRPARLWWTPVLLIVLGCAQKQYVWKSRTHQDQVQFNRDMIQCQTYAAQVAPYMQADPMESAAIRFLGGRGAEAGVRFDRATISCMNGLGYYLEDAGR